MIELPKHVFFNLCQRDIKHNIVFQSGKIISYRLTVILNVFSQSSNNQVIQNMVNIQTYKHISRYIWLSSQVFRGIAAPKFQEDRSVLRW